MFDRFVSKVVATASKHIIWNGTHVASRLTKLLGDCLSIPRDPLEPLQAIVPTIVNKITQNKTLQHKY